MKCLILAGGSGTRLWPLSRRDFPKQFLRLGDKRSFLQNTVLRNLAIFGAENLYILTSHNYYHDVAKQLEEISYQLHDHILIEPSSKNTAPAIAFALKTLQSEPDEPFLITPSDHMISPQDRYTECILEGFQYAREGYLVTFGIRPTRPETGYGYLKTKGIHVEKFVEKPNLKKAQDFLLSGDYFWNAGLFCLTRKMFEQEALHYCPDLIEKEFHEMPSISIDYAIMEHSQKVVMLSLDLTWSDIGSWDNVYDLLDKDENQNVLEGQVMPLDTRNSLIYAESRLVSTIGLENLVVIETPDVVLICQKGESQRVKELVEELKQLGQKEAFSHLTTHRPWGFYTVMMEGIRHKIKKIFVYPKQKLSLQMHYHRSEHWIIVSGTARVTIGDNQEILHEGESIFVPKSAIHRIENPGIVALEIIEVQVGEYLGEDDIVRFEDIYGRLKETPVPSYH